MISSEDPGLVMILLDALDSLLGLDEVVESENSVHDQLESLGGVTKLEELQLHKNTEVYKRAIKLLDKQYQIEECAGEVIEVQKLGEMGK